MSDNIYFDGVESVGVIGGNVRLELFRYIPDPEANSTDKRVPAGSLVMSLEGFLRTHQSVDKLMTELKERNVVTPRQTVAAPKTTENNSPNFASAEA